MSSSSQSGSKPTGTHVNPDPSPEVAAIPTDKATRQRGPVEEVIFKRMKQLGKKLQRYRAYAAQDVNSLNADQRAALVALPALEGAYKELEDLVREKGPVEEQELIQSAKLREATDAARAAALAEAGTSTEQYKSSLAKPLSLFLRLHTLLHPARASDHEHLTFAPLDLPDNLSDEVQATDVIRVGRLYEDLLTGGEAAQGVLDVLVSGPNGEDEENDHVHYLLDLLSQPAPAPSQVVESATDTPAEPATDADFTAAALAESVEAATEATPEAVVSQEDVPMSSANGHATAHQPAKTTINFLQEDELEVLASAGAVAPAETAEAAEPADDLKDDPIEQSYEIVPSLEAHQTSGQQPPVEEASATRPSATSRAPSNFAPAPTGSWADLDDEEDFLGAAQTAATQFASAITENATPASDEPTESAAAAEGSSSRDKSSTKAQRGKGRGRGGQNRPRQGGRQPSQSQEQDGQQQERPPRQQRPPRQSREPKQQSQEQSQVAPGGKVVDDDGFEVKARRGPQQPTRGTGGTRSLTRGAPRGGPGGAGRGGNNGRGGRGGAGATGQRAAAGQQEQRKPSQSQGQNGAKSNGSATPAAGGIASTLKPKPSIFKAVQPTGPKSAPIIS